MYIRGFIPRSKCRIKGPSILLSPPSGVPFACFKERLKNNLFSANTIPVELPSSATEAGAPPPANEVKPVSQPLSNNHEI